MPAFERAHTCTVRTHRTPTTHFSDMRIGAHTSDLHSTGVRTPGLHTACMRCARTPRCALPHTYVCKLCAHCAVCAHQACMSFGARQACAHWCALTDHLVHTACMRCARCARGVRCAKKLHSWCAACAHSAYPCLIPSLILSRVSATSYR